jgi:geranylgeranyl diphosphate synthase, type I
MPDDGKLQTLSAQILPEIEAALRRALEPIRNEKAGELYQMLAYHMGWETPETGPKTSGKRIRPLMVALTTGASGGQWSDSLAGGVAIELIHNFSLIHDDIQDNSPLRRGRPTVWKRWGIAQAINAGDAMLSLANRAILDLRGTNPESVTLEAAGLLQDTCLDLTRGQYLDLSYQNRTSLDTTDYWPMVAGKTASLIACCADLGALIGRSPDPQREAYRAFGYHLGLAFQVQDDLLGIWGEGDQMGKSNQSDLLEGKMSLPVLYGIEQGGGFANRWLGGPILPDEVESLADQLAGEGAYEYTRTLAIQHTEFARQALDRASPQEDAGEAIYQLLEMLLNRKM